LLEKEKQALEFLFKASEQALAASQARLESQLAQQAGQREQLLSERRDEREQMRVCLGRVHALSSGVSAVLAAREKQ
jgi:hypothetical protein